MIHEVPKPEQQPEEPEIEFTEVTGELVQIPAVKIQCPECKEIMTISHGQFVMEFHKGNNVQFPCPKCQAPLVTVRRMIQVVPGNCALPPLKERKT